MSAETNKDLLRRFVAAANERDFDAFQELVAPDVVRHSPSTPGLTVRSRDEFLAFLRQDLAAVPDSVQTIHIMVAEDDRIAAWLTYSGTQQGQMGPFPPTGKHADVDFAAILRIADGRIAEMWVVWDNVSMLTQLGHMAPPGE